MSKKQYFHTTLSLYLLYGNIIIYLKLLVYWIMNY